MHSTKMYRKTRLAPTPSGYLHLGNLASFILTCSLARNYGAEILLRIDDLDQQRVRKEYVQDIFDTLDFFGLPIDQGPRSAEEHFLKHSQAHRKKNYANLIEELSSKNLLFACQCSRSLMNASGSDAGCIGQCESKHIHMNASNVSLRMKTDSDTFVELFDLKSGQMKFKFPLSMHEFIVRKKDGEAAYQLASVADDLFFEVDFIVRGQDLFDSTLAQLYLSSYLSNTEFLSTTFFHHPLLFSTLNQKLSKSAGDLSIMHLRKSGLSSNEILNLLARMVNAGSDFSSWEELGDWLIDNWLNATKK